MTKPASVGLKSISFGSLAFYIGTIGVVVVLFSLASTYGETVLKAPRLIQGRYRLAAEVLPNCLQGQSVDLLIQQSGIYVAGAIVPQNATAKTWQAAEEHPSLTGSWDNHTLLLQGNVSSTVPGCSAEIALQAQVSGAAPDHATKGTPANQPLTLAGTIQTGSPALPFQAQLLPKQTQLLTGH